MPQEDSVGSTAPASIPSISFSIIVPCYNDADVLARCLTSLGTQTHAAHEIIVVDDGSTDDVAVVFNSFAAGREERCVYFRQDNAGVSCARNQGIELAESSHLVFVDADDELCAQSLHEYYCQLTQSPAAQWLIAHHELERDGHLKARSLKLPSTKQARFELFLDKKLALGNVTNMCFAREVFDALKFPDALKFGEDAVVFAILFTQVDPLLVDVYSAIAHRRKNSLRRRATLTDLVNSRVHAEIFEHPLLPAEYQKFAAVHWARNCRSIARRAYQEQNYSICVHWYQQMIRAYPKYIFDARMLARYLNAKRFALKGSSETATNFSD